MKLQLIRSQQILPRRRRCFARRRRRRHYSCCHHAGLTTPGSCTSSDCPPASPGCPDSPAAPGPPRSPTAGERRSLWSRPSNQQYTHVYSASLKPIPELCSITYHMGHSIKTVTVECYLPPDTAVGSSVLNLPAPEGWKAELTLVDGYGSRSADGLPVCRHSPIQTLTGPGVEKLSWVSD